MEELLNLAKRITADVQAVCDLNAELIVALNKCRNVLDEICVDHRFPLWAEDQMEAIAMADAVLAKVMEDAVKGLQ